MVPTLGSIKSVWVEVAGFKSKRLQLLVVGVAAVTGFLITWELSETWEQAFGYSSVMTVLTTIVVFFVLYWFLSYVVTRRSIRN